MTSDPLVAGSGFIGDLLLSSNSAQLWSECLCPVTEAKALQSNCAHLPSQLTVLIGFDCVGESVGDSVNAGSFVSESLV